MKIAILILAFVATSPCFATPLGDALNACVSNSTFHKIGTDGGTDVRGALNCRGQAAQDLYTQLNQSGFGYQDAKTSTGESVKVIQFGNIQNGSQCRFLYLDRDDKSISIYSCNMNVDLHSSLLPHIGF